MNVLCDLWRCQFHPTTNYTVPTSTSLRLGYFNLFTYPVAALIGQYPSRLLAASNAAGLKRYFAMDSCFAVITGPYRWLGTADTRIPYVDRDGMFHAYIVRFLGPWARWPGCCWFAGMLTWHQPNAQTGWWFAGRWMQHQRQTDSRRPDHEASPKPLRSTMPDYASLPRWMVLQPSTRWREYILPAASGVDYSETDQQ